MKPKIILTCEHADFKTPTFIDTSERVPLSIRKSHLGWDQGAFSLAKNISNNISCELFFYPYSRLYIDANRNVAKKSISPLMGNLSHPHTTKLLKMSQAYRDKIYKSVELSLKKKQSIFIFSIHSFVPKWKGKVRNTDIGILYRTHINKEQQLANSCKKILSNENSKLKIHKNLPYRGHTECFLNDLLDHYYKSKIINGLFFEFNQRILKDQKSIKEISQLIGKAFKQLIDNIE